MCNCHTESQQRLFNHIKTQLPAGATGLDVELQGYVFGLGDPGGISHRAACPVEITYQAPKKGGAGMKTVKQRTMLRATFCPFCGEKYEKDNAAAEPCDHQWTDDGMHLLVCTECGAQEDHDPKWRDMATAPRDGTMLRLLVNFTEHSTEDDEQAPTIGANNFDNDGEDRWLFAGWCWSHDHFTQGEGEPVGWLPMLNEPVLKPGKGGEE